MSMLLFGFASYSAHDIVYAPRLRGIWLYGRLLWLRQAAPDAVRRLIDLVQSADERVAAVACNAILDRAFGKPRESVPPAESSVEHLGDKELRCRIVDALVAGGVPGKTARAFADGSLKARVASGSDVSGRGKRPRVSDLRAAATPSK
jgi:hypothetical protein